MYQSTSEIYGILGGRKCDSKPPVPKRCSSLERPQMSSSGSVGAGSVTSISSLSSSQHKSGKGAKDKKGGGGGDRSTGVENRVVPNLPDFNQSAPDMSKSS